MSELSFRFFIIFLLIYFIFSSFLQLFHFCFFFSVTRSQYFCEWQMWQNICITLSLILFIITLNSFYFIICLFLFFFLVCFFYYFLVFLILFIIFSFWFCSFWTIDFTLQPIHGARMMTLSLMQTETLRID